LLNIKLNQRKLKTKIIQLKAVIKKITKAGYYSIG